MELVYLWVEGYKNIHKQGFNFSPRFHCEFKPVYKDDKEEVLDEEKSKLIICDREDKNCKEKEKYKKFCHEPYIKNFFDDNGNISVTAIVGKNGSGKSNILELLHNIFLGNFPDTRYILFINENGLSYISNIDLNKLEVSIKDKAKKINKLNNMDWYIYLLYRKKDFIEDFEKRHIISLDKNEIANTLANSFSSEVKFELSSFMYLPNKIKIKPINLDKILMNIIADDFSLNYIPSSYYDFIRNNKKKFDGYKKKEDLEDITDLLDEIGMTELLEKIDNFHKFLILLNECCFNTKTLENKNSLLKIYNKYPKKIEEKKFNTYFRERTILFKDLTKEEKEFYFSEYYKLFTFDFIDSKDRHFNHLSHGEQIIFGILLKIYSYSLDLKEKYIANPFSRRPDNYSLYYMLDEPDLSLHPNWQKNYINEIINLLRKIECNNYNLIFTTHSPFLLSDIPKQNTIFLDTYNDKSKEKYPNLNLDNLKYGNCINVSSEIDIKPFGANIHELLSHGFFMEDGLMGEFAKNKIQKIIDFLNSESKFEDLKISQEQMKLIIESIGEDLLRIKLLDMYYDKLEQDKLEKEMQKLLEQQKEIQKRIESIKAKQK